MAISRSHMGKQMSRGGKKTAKKAEGGRAEPPWKKDNPKKESKPLTAAQKARARAAAKKAGRRYPNLVDNMRASRTRG